MKQIANEFNSLEKFKESKKFWLERLSEDLHDRIVMYDYNTTLEYEQANINIELDRKICEKILKISGNVDLLTYVIMLSAFQIQCYRYVNNNFIINVPVYEKNEGSITANNDYLPLRSFIKDETEVKALIGECRRELLEVYKNQHYPLQQLRNEIPLPVGQFSFSMSNIHKKQNIDKLVSLGKNQINIRMERVQDSISLNVAYNSKLYMQSTIVRMTDSYLKILGKAVNNVNARACDIDILTAEETNRILYEFNNTKKEYPKHKTVKELFEEEVKNGGENTALQSNGEVLSYHQLNQRSNQLAHLLRRKSVTRDTVVPVICDRSVNSIISMVSIIKAGGAYLPIDEEYPESRIKYMLEDSNSKIVLGRQEQFKKLNLDQIDIELIDLENKEILNESRENPETVNLPEDIAYVIYTSGSTGKPKGVCIENRSVVKNSRNTSFIEVEKSDRFLQSGSLSFDAAVLPIWIALLNGIALHVENNDLMLDFNSLEKYIIENNITLVVFPTTLFNQFSQERIDAFKNMKHVIAGGDVISSKQASRLVERYKNLKVVNGYGPTENTVISTGYIVTGEWDENKAVPIGKPVSNSTAYIMDKNNMLLPIGIVGELCVGGDGVARGYLNREELTREKFIENPYVKGEKIYKTGDLARWLPDGNIEFWGRVDNQVKIQGFRIELGEIESQLTRYAGVKEAVVIDRKDNNGNKYLCGYVVGEGEIPSKELKESLRKDLPGYMVPAHIIKLKEMPLTPNGKIDKKALPEPDLSQSSTEYIAPRNETEEKLAQIWCEILDIEKVGVTDNFFDIGGHSLKAVNLVSRIQKEFNVAVKVSDIFDKPSVEKLAAYFEQSAKGLQKGNALYYDEIEIVPKSWYYAASMVQKRMYAINQIDTESKSYNIPGIYTAKGKLDKEKLENALKQLIARHEALRTSFHVIDGEVVQRVYDDVEFVVEYINLEGTLADKKREADKAVDAFIRSFDLGKAPLIRGGVIQLIDTSILLLDMHHIVSDGVSAGILMNEMAALYNGKPLKDIRVQYKDFANWQNKLYETGALKSQEEYWLGMYGDEVPILNMPVDYNRSALESFEGSDVTVHLQKELAEEIKKVLKKTGTTKYMFYLTVFNILLGKYSGQDDIVVGTPNSGRTHSSVENTVGMFVNTLAMRNHPKGEKKFNEFLQQVKESSIKAFENQDYELQMLIDKLNIKKEKNRNLLFDVMFSVENLEDKELDLGDIKLSRYEIEYNVSKFDISLDVFQDISDDKKVMLNFNYNTGLFRRETIEKLSECYINIIKAVVLDQEINIKDIDIVTEDDMKLIKSFNMTDKEYLGDMTIHKLFEAQVLKTPDNIAVRFGDVSLTYKELNEKANSLARLLREKGVTRESIVAVMVYRSQYMLLGALATLKAGGAYVPVDPDYPEDRIKYMLNNCNAKIVLSQKDLIKDLGWSLEKEFIDIQDESIYSGIPNTNLKNINKPEDLMYIIYTSGTTGNPKGVMVEHKNVVNIASSWIKDYKLNEMNVKLLQIASFSFDVFVGDLCRALLSGGEMVICPKDVRLDPMGMYDLITANGISILESTPGLVIAFMDYVYENNLPIDSLKLLIIGSDICSVEDFNKLNERYGKQMRILNSYGITETTIDSSFFELSEDKKVASLNVPIGKPMQNTKFYVLGNNRKMVPIGVFGELYIGGDGVTRGYLNKELTEEKFIDDPYRKGSKMYKTGDMGRWLPDGNLELVGRIDNQIKIRGFRIELGEIESQLLRHEKVSEAVVIVKKHSNQSNYLVGFVVGDSDLTEAEMRKYLQSRLANYMVPTSIIKLDKMPLTPNGKVDRKLLSEMDVNVEGIEYTAPRNEVEERLARVWGEVLGIERVGIKDNFFELGGHSLKAVNMVSKIHKEFSVKIKVADIFEKPSIEELSACLGCSGASEGELPVESYEEIKQVEKQEYYATSSVQKRMYAINQLDTNSTNYNMPDVFEVKGKLDRVRLENAFKELIRRHESFRTSLHLVNGEIVQRVHDNVCFELNCINIEGKPGKPEEVLNNEINKFISPFDLSKAPLIKAGIIEAGDTSVLIIDVHHIIGDGLSTGIILSELRALYAGYELGKVKVQYKDFANWQNKLYETDAMKKQEEFWLENFSGEIPVLNLPTDYKRPAAQSFEGSVSHFNISPASTAKINSAVRGGGVTKFMFFLAAYNVLLSKYSGQEDIVIGNPSVGRTHASLFNTVGMFLNTLPLRNAPRSSMSFRELLTELKENSLRAFENQDYDLARLVEKLGVKQNTGRNPLFDVMFTLQNLDNERIEIGEATLTARLGEHNTSKFDLSLFVFADENDGEISGMFEYKTTLYKKGTIERLAYHYKNILRQAAENIDIKLADIDIVTEEEKNTLINKFNNTSQEYSKSSTLKELFERQVEKTPENIAAFCKNSSMTYKELNNKANQLAVLLRDKGIKPNDPVGVLMERSLEVVIAVIAIIKAGGACLPISSEYPENRIKHMLEDSRAKAVITSKQYKAKASCHNNPEVICIDSEGLFKNGFSSNLNEVNSCEDLLYIIYTSGTTGKPKGVMQTHKTINNLAEHEYTHTDVPFGDKVLQFATIGFDVFFQEVFSTLLAGGQLFIINDEEKKDVKKLCEFIDKNSINTIFLPTAFLKFIFSSKKYSDMFPGNIKHIITAGEALIISELLKDYINRTKTMLHNHYGPSETHVVTTYVIEPGKDIPSVPSIGKPIINTSVYILDKNLKLQPIGVPGELYLSGDCLAAGYLNDYELTKLKFIENPFAPGERMYKTGDLARWLPDGNIEFLGRLDHQVKIRGFRVELSEIQEQVLNYKGVQEAVVIVKDQNGNEYICAYYLADEKIPAKELKDYLSKELPGYMMPSRLIQVDKIPITANGKVDKARLLEIDDGMDIEDTYIAASTKTEKDIEEIWKQVLKLERVGIDDNFFDVGGNSILVLSMLSHLDNLYPDKLSVADIFANPTICRLAKFIDGSEPAENLNIEDSSKAKEIKVNPGDIAIIGIAFRFPMANDIAEFWEKIRSGTDCISEIPEERKKDVSKYYKFVGMDSELGYSEMGYIDEIDKFDHKFFSLSPKEASLMDPNQRMFLEIAWQAIEDSGYGGKKIAGSRTGVYMGYANPVMGNYMDIISKVNPSLIPSAVTGNLSSMIPSRIGYIMDFRGPSTNIDTACSSSLVALHNACRGIKNGDCDIAIAGSSELVIFPVKNEHGVGIESKTNRTKSFDDDSDGTGVGEGVIALVLKPLNKALRDRDNIYAVIKGSAINQDGNSIGITAPNSVAQEDVIVNAWKDAGIAPETISYIETHGTATNLGDPIEIDGISRAFRKFTTRRQFCAIGALKSSIGHLGGAAGIAGVLKAVLSLKNGELAPIVHLKRPSRKISFENSPVYLIDNLKKWDTNNEIKRCGVSSFGLSGTNCHVILEEAPCNEPTGRNGDSESSKVLAISAKSESALKALVKKYIDMLKKYKDIDLADVCYTANTGRGHYGLRLAFIIEDRESLIELLERAYSDLNNTGGDGYIFFSNCMQQEDVSPDEIRRLSEISNDKINRFITEGKNDKAILRDICELYVKEADIDWDLLYKGEERRRIRIPVYPFDRIRCWVDIPEDVQLKQSEKNYRHESRNVVRLAGRTDGSYSETEKLVAGSWGEALGYKELGIGDNFYEIGGDSVIGIQIVNDISRKLNLTVNITDLLLSETIEKMAEKLDGKLLENEQSRFLTIAKADNMPYYPLSSAQKRMFITSTLEACDTAYNIYGACLIEGNLDAERVQNTINKIIERHEAFRTSFDIIKGEPVQIIHENVELRIALSEASEADIDKEFKSFIRPFDLKTAPLIRSKILKVRENKFVFMFDMHHIISDGYSMSIFVDEFMKIYNGQELSEIKIQYKDFAVWQNKYIESEEMRRQEQFWLAAFAGEIPVLDIPTDFPMPVVKNYDGADVRVGVEPGLMDKINKLTRAVSTTLYNVLLAAYNVVLMKHTGQNDIVIGSASAGRQNADCEKIVGMFVNMLAMRNYPDCEKTFAEFLGEVTKNSFKAFDNQGYQFEKLVDKLGLERTSNRGMLFDTTFTLQNIRAKEFKIEDFKITNIEYETSKSAYPISLVVFESDGKLILSFEYQTSIFKESTVETLARNYVEVLTQVTENANLKLKQIMLSNNYIIADVSCIKEDDINFDF